MGKRLMKNLFALLQRHAQAFWYVLTVILPVLFRTGRRPVIFSRFAGMGDIICTIPAALELKKRHPGATFIYNCDASSACLPKMGGVTEHVASLKPIGLVGFWYRWLLAEFYSFNSDDDDLTADDTENSLVAFGQRLGVTTGESHPHLEINTVARQQIQSILAKCNCETSTLIIIHTGPSSPVRQWSREAWTKLVQSLRQHGYTNIVQLGARVGSYMQAAATEAQPIPGVISLVEQLSLEQSIALISLGKLYVGIDSGLLHIAASVQTPAVGIWGPTTPRFRFSEGERRWFVTSQVECQGCHHRMPRLHWETNCPHNIHCMKEISVVEVLRACLQNLTLEIKP